MGQYMGLAGVLAFILILAGIGFADVLRSRRAARKP